MYELQEQILVKVKDEDNVIISGDKYAVRECRDCIIVRDFNWKHKKRRDFVQSSKSHSMPNQQKIFKFKLNISDFNEPFRNRSPL